MTAESSVTVSLANIAAAIGEPARARMLCCLMDGRARTSTELAIIAQVSPSTASVHLQRLIKQRLLIVCAQGKHRYYSLQGKQVARMLESLSVLAGEKKFVPNTPGHLRNARTCYDHIAGTLGVVLYARMISLKWLAGCSHGSSETCVLTRDGTKCLNGLGVDVEGCLALRRRFAYPCLDWSERRPHLGGSLGAALLDLALKRKWVEREFDSRALHITGRGQREMHALLGVGSGKELSIATA